MGINYYKNVCVLNNKLYEKIILKSIGLTMKLPNIQPIKINEEYESNGYIYTNKILISSNSYCSLKVKNEYIRNLEYLQEQGLIINEEYLNYLLNIDIKELKELTEGQINLEVLLNINKINFNEFYKALI
jgi:hypothetical protein